MSNACDPRNRPGYISGDPVPFLEPTPTTNAAVADARRIAAYAWTSALLIVVSVVVMVLFSQ